MLTIGTKKRDICYDGKEHELTLTDYLVKLTGNTYNYKNDIYNEEFIWDAHDRAWYKNIDTEEEINRLYNKFQNKQINFSLKPIFRITDKL